MDLKRLEIFLTIAELGSLSRAADRLRVAQPALSRQMRVLEAEVGTPLFARHRRGMLLTSAGEELRNRLAGPVRQVRQTIDDARSGGMESGGSVALGIPPTASYLLAGRLARRVAQQAPKISLRIVEGYAGHLVDWLQRGEIDLAILYGPASDFQMKVEDLLFEQLVLVGGSASDLHPEKPMTMQALEGMPLALPSQPHGLRMIVENAARRGKLRLTIKFEADSFLVLKELAEFGLSYTLLPLSALGREIDAQRLRYAPVVQPVLIRQLVLGVARQYHLSRATNLLMRLLRDEIRELVEQGVWKAQLQY